MNGITDTLIFVWRASRNNMAPSVLHVSEDMPLNASFIQMSPFYIRLFPKLKIFAKQYWLSTVNFISLPGKGFFIESYLSTKSLWYTFKSAK